MNRTTKWIMVAMMLFTAALFVMNMTGITHLSVWVLLAPIYVPLIPWVFTVVLLWFHERGGE